MVGLKENKNKNYGEIISKSLESDHGGIERYLLSLWPILGTLLLESDHGGIERRKKMFSYQMQVSLLESDHGGIESSF